MAASGMLRFYEKEGEYVTIEELLTWVRDEKHRLPDGRCIPVCIWGSRGSGKCVTPDTLVVVNGTLQKIGDCWDQFADEVEVDEDGGEWATLKSALLVPSLDDDGQLRQMPVTRLYRQRVNEMGRRVRLSDGSTITMTQAHRLLGVDGWQRELSAGDMVAVPRAIAWAGEDLDPDFITLLAWQIAEGNEDHWGRLKITQKDIAVLERVRAAAARWSERSGIELNGMSIHAHKERDIHTLQINSAAYRDYLLDIGYRWGARSAQKRIPDCVVSASDRSIARFVGEFWSADGHVNVKRGAEITLASELLTRQLQLMLRRFGVWMPVKSKLASASNGARIKRVYWRGTISGDSARRFASAVTIADEAKQERLQQLIASASNTNVEGVPAGDLIRAIQQTSELPQRVLDFVPSRVSGRKSFGRAQLAPLVAACAAIETRDVIVPRTSAKDGWAAVSEARLEALYADAPRFAAFGELSQRLRERVGLDAYWARVDEVEAVPLDGYVYDFEVGETHNYVASMICTHNTSQIKAFCDKNNLEMKVYHPAHDVNGQDIVGTPVVDEKTGKTTYALPEWLPQDEDTQGVWFIDEINRGTLEVLAGLMEPLGEGTISQSNWKLPRGWQIVVAANPTERGYQTHDMDEAMIDRLLHYNPGWEAPTWAAWAQGAGIPQDVIDFALRRTNELASASDLGEFQLPQEIESKMAATPRSLTYFAALYEEGMPDRLLTTIGYGLIGREATTSFREMISGRQRALPANFILSEPRVDDQQRLIYPYEAYVQAWTADPAEGPELLHGSVMNLVVGLINHPWPEGFVDDDGTRRPAVPGDDKSKVRPAETVEENRPAQLAGRFLATLPPDNRQEAFDLIARSAPDWKDVVHEAAMTYLKTLAPRQVQQVSQAPTLQSGAEGHALPDAEPGTGG